ncbi:hypothetical protein AZE42_13700 [Rhizopogon vesiculosus]|uniref:Uncharacterized protein n=1 Tax=Rhizopogon vesiculosus TaxID=180088 RepID=A0A1J8R4G3_9AGAM|nr:hypothetical protein AZE42_13700 [Rhizopogon vesiculosus]
MSDSRQCQLQQPAPKSNLTANTNCSGENTPTNRPVLTVQTSSGTKKSSKGHAHLWWA